MSKTQFQYDSTTEQENRALLVTIRGSEDPVGMAEFRKEELESLCSTLGFIIAESVIVPLRSPKASYLVGTGKVTELSELAKHNECDLIVFDHDLSPSQQRNWEKSSQLCVIDRTEVILQIFAERASTREAVLQVALARQEYSLPRLRRAWTHLSRQRGGSKGTRGEGETQLEIDRRLVMHHISRIKDELKKVRANRMTQRSQRQSLPVPTGSIVGYTNAGKSSLLHHLTQADILIEDKLFATLDPTTKRLVLPRGTEILLTDTVGFVQDLPHDLIDAFRSTLEETRYSDFIIHVIDASHPQPMVCYRTTMEVLESLGCADKPMIVILNKMDLCQDLVHLATVRQAHELVLPVSVKDQTGIDGLLDAIEQTLFSIYPTEKYLLPADRFDLLAFIRRNGSILSEEYEDSSIRLEARIPERFRSALKQFLIA